MLHLRLEDGTQNDGRLPDFSEIRARKKRRDLAARARRSRFFWLWPEEAYAVAAMDGYSVLRR